MVSESGMFVKRLSTSKLAIYKFLQFLITRTSSTNEVLFLTVYSLTVNCSRMGTKYLAILKEGVLYAAKMGLNWKFVKKFSLWILGRP